MQREKRYTREERDKKLDELGAQFDRKEITWSEYRRLSTETVARWPKNTKGKSG